MSSFGLRKKKYGAVSYLSSCKTFIVFGRFLSKLARICLKKTRAVHFAMNARTKLNWQLPVYTAVLVRKE